MRKATKGISFLNPVDVEEGYLNYCADYDIRHGIKHFELIDPTQPHKEQYRRYDILPQV